VDRAHLARTFRSVFGCTVGEYVRAARLSRAAGLLRSGKKSVSAIAAEVGFADHAHLTRNFSGVYGRSPTDYRRGV
jgi:transcriptional regulator GlxA family with amidase domain